MTRNLLESGILTLALAVLIMAGTGLAAGAPAVLEYDLASVDQVPVLRVAPVDRAALLAEDAAKAARAGDGPERFAVAAKVAVSPAADGLWEQPTALHRVWRLRIQAEGALSLNLAFPVFDLPAGGVLRLYPADLKGPADPRGVREFTARDADITGGLWTPVVLADDIVVEVEIPDGAGRPRLQLAAVNRGYRLFGEDPEAKSGACNIDVVCSEGDPWRQEIAAVGLYTIDGVWKCSGSLINNTRRDGTPLFLTAYHCNNSMQTFAHTVVAYWNYQSPVCGQHGGGTLDQFTTGAIFRATFQASDFTLIEMDEPLDPAFGLTFAGWDRRDRAPAGAIAIHHPSLDEKSISFENDPLSVTTYLDTPVPGDGTHLRITDWDLGTTEPGSSGSPLFDPDHHIIGQLHGGYAACPNNESDWYGRLFASWTGGGTSDSRLGDWLDPAGTGEEFIDALDPAGSEMVVTPATDLAFSGVQDGDTSGMQGTYVVRNPGSAPLPYQVTADQTWLSVDPATGTVAAGDSVTITVTLAAQALTQPVGTSTATLSFANLDGGLGDTIRQVTLEIQSLKPAISYPAPNPFTDFTTVAYTLPADLPVRARILDVQGRGVRDLGVENMTAGRHEVSWNGRNDAGGRVAAGLYILRLEAPGYTFSARMTLWR